MASNPPAACCYQGVKHEGQAAGRMEKCDSFEYYVSEPKQPTGKGILMITDVIGHKFINGQLVADQFAANGYFVMMPDLFDGDTVPLHQPQDLPKDFDIMAWLGGKYHPKGRSHTTDDVDPIIEKSIAIMKEKYGVKKLAACGYCFGAKYVVRFLKPGMIDVGNMAHPSFVGEDELKAIKGPLSVSAAEIDDIFTPDLRHRSEEILKETGQPYQINYYSGVEHGFAIRGDPKNRLIQYAKESAFFQAIQWFEEYLK